MLALGEASEFPRHCFREYVPDHLRLAVVELIDALKRRRMPSTFAHNHLEWQLAVDLAGSTARRTQSESSPRV